MSLFLAENLEEEEENDFKTKRKVC